MQDLLETLLVFIGMGAFLDTVFMGDAEKARLRDYIARERIQDRTDFPAFLAVVRAIVFDRFFSAGFLSWRFFLSVSVASLASFVLASLAGSLYAGRDIGFLLGGRAQVGVVLALILLNFVVDYLAVIQTRIFIDAAIASRSTFRSLVLILLNLLVAINVFILLFSLFVMGLMWWHNREERSIKLVFAEAAAAGDLIPFDVSASDTISAYYGARELPGPVAGELPVTFVVLSGDEHGVYRTRFAVSEGVTPRDVASLFLNRFGPLAVSDARLSDLSVEEAAGLRNSDFGQTLLEGDGLRPGVIVVEADVRQEFRTLRELHAAYTTSFQIVDYVIEDSFPGSLLSYGYTTMQEYSRQFISFLADNPPRVFCFAEEEGIRVQGMEADVSACARVIYSARSEEQLLTLGIGVVGRVGQPLYIPEITMFLTTLLPTVAIYVTSIFVYVLLSLKRSVLAVGSRANAYVLRAPLACGGLLTGLIWIVISRLPGLF